MDKVEYVDGEKLKIEQWVKNGCRVRMGQWMKVGT